MTTSLNNGHTSTCRLLHLQLEDVATHETKQMFYKLWSRVYLSVTGYTTILLFTIIEVTVCLLQFATVFILNAVFESNWYHIFYL